MKLPHILPRSPRLSAALAGGFYAACLGLAFPPFDIAPLALVALVPVFMVLKRQDASPRALAFSATAGMLPFWCVEEFWISRMTGAGYIPLCLILAAINFIPLWLIARSARRFTGWKAALAAALLWCGMDALRGEILFDGYPWYYVGHPLVMFGPLAAAVGAMGVSFVAVLLQAFAASGGRTRWHETRLPLVFALVFALVLAGVLQAPQSSPTQSESTFRVAVVQTNVAQEIKSGGGIESQLAEMDDLERLTKEAAVTNPDLIVWPETMKPGLSLDSSSVRAERDAGIFYRVPGLLGSDQRVPSTIFAERVLELSRSVSIPIIVGEEAFTNLRFPTGPQGGVQIKYDARYNSAFLVIGGAVSETRYDKLHLTPFGEYMPYIRAVPWLQKRLLDLGAQGMQFDLSEGTRLNQLTVPRSPSRGGFESRSIKVATPICFEVADVSTVRRLSTGADVIVTLTNDGWFGDHDMLRLQHAQLARWRAMELGIPVIRCANTGLSCAFDASGRPLRHVGKLPAPGMRTEGVGTFDVPLATGPTFFAHRGWVLPWLIMSGAGVVAAHCVRRTGTGNSAQLLSGNRDTEPRPF